MEESRNPSVFSIDAFFARFWPYLTEEVAEYFNNLYQRIDPKLPRFTETGPYTFIGFPSDAHRLHEDEHLALYERIWLIVDEGARKLRLADHPHFFSHATDKPVYIRGTQTLLRPALGLGRHHFKLIVAAKDEPGDPGDATLFEGDDELQSGDEPGLRRRDAILGGPEPGQISALYSNLPAGDRISFNIWLGGTMAGKPENPASPCGRKGPRDPRCEPFPAEFHFHGQPPQRVSLVWRGIDTIRSTDVTLFQEMSAFGESIPQGCSTARLTISGLQPCTDYAGGGNEHTANGHRMVTVS